MKENDYLAIDIGAESGRAVRGRLDENGLTVEEVYRFPNGMITRRGRLHWDAERIFGEIGKGIRECVRRLGSPPRCLGLDTWGVDFGLLGADDALLSLPFAYREPRNRTAMEKFLGLVPAEHIYGLTGIQFLPFNSLFQLFAMKLFDPGLLASARSLLFMPDIFNFWLTGKKTTEFTFATTSQLYNPIKGDWADEIFEALEVPRTLMQSVVEPGTMLGPAARFSGIPVVAVASHDTASAVAAVPAREMNWAFISSGTWSIMGVETAAPVIDERTRTLNWTNEGGPGRTFRLSKNISGLWLLQQCRKTWDAGRSYSYDDLVRLAGTEPPFRSFIDPDAPDFLNPPDMPDAIRKFCRRRGQPEPRSPAETTRCILESLALKSRFVLDELRQISPHPIEKIHIIGGGVRNALLCRLTAEATRLPVSAGPAEATAVGNIMIQALASGAVGSSAELRDLVARSVRPVEYEPGLRDAWEEAYARFLGMLAGGPD